MARIVLTSTATRTDHDPILRRRLLDLLTLFQGSTQDEPWTESVPGAKDTRVRTTYVDGNHRAVLFRIVPDVGDTTYIYMGTWPTQEAVRLAARAMLRVNPVSGVLEGTVGRPELLATGPTTSLAVQPVLERDGRTAAEIAEDLGLDRTITERACRITDRAEFVRFAEQVSATLGWQGQALLQLLDGVAPAQIREQLELHAPDDTMGAEDDRIIAALDHPASRLQFTYAEDSAELRRVIDSGDADAWRTFLHPEQRRYAERSYPGSFRVSGGSGTGKSVILVHRARNLILRDPTARVVLTTFTKELATILQTNLRILDPDIPIVTKLGQPGIYVGGIDSLVIQVLRQSAEFGPASQDVFGHSKFQWRGKRPDRNVWPRIAGQVNHQLPPHLTTPWFLENEYVAVVLARRIRTFHDYATTDRRGRRIRLDRATKHALWKIFDSYRQFCARFSWYSYQEVAAVAARYLMHDAADGGAALADHVLVDEGQDLHAVHWRFVRALVDEGADDIFIADDPHQRIFSERITLSDHNIVLSGRSRRLTLNYRTTAQNLDFALAFLSDTEFRDLEDRVEPGSGYRSARLGPEPSLLPCSSEEEVLNRIVHTVRGWHGSGTSATTIAVLAFDNGTADTIRTSLRSEDFVVDDDSDEPQPPIAVRTMSGAKGLEYTHVIVAGVDPSNPPAAAVDSNGSPYETADAEQRAKALAYVAATRARDQLVFIWH